MTDLFAAWSRRLRASETSALTEVFKALHEPLVRYAMRILQTESAAYDVVQESFIKLWERRQKLDPDQSLKAYLFVIVRNTALKYMKSQHTVQFDLAPEEQSIVDGNSPPDLALSADELKLFLRRCIEELPPRRQEAFRLSRYESLSHEEIAQVMGLAPRTVTHHIMLALRHLRTRLQEYQASV